MSEITLLTWDGGGNVAVALAIAAAVRARGHTVTVAGPRSLQPLVEPNAIGFTELGVPAPHDPHERLDYLLDVAQGTDAMADELRRLAERTDALVIDCNLSWALQTRVSRRTAVLVHTALGIYLPVWQAVLDLADAERTRQGLPPLLSAADAWAWPDLLVVATAAQFDRPLPRVSLSPVYVGPVTAGPRHESASSAVPPPSAAPRVLVSYSTDSLQNSPLRLQTALDALAGLPIDVLATTSGTFDAGRLRIPSNATVVDYVPHEAVIPHAALVVCHAGHGTTMAALTRGVPVVCVPGPGRDQAPIAQRADELGLGVALSGDATAPIIRGAVETVLADGSYLERARAFARELDPGDGAERAAAELLALLDSR